MMAYTLRYENELRDEKEYFRDIKETVIDPESLELAETLIAKRSMRLDLSKFEDGYDIALRKLIEAKVNNLPAPQDESPQDSRSNVVSLMDALRKSIGETSSQAATRPAKKPVTRAKPETKKGIGLVKGAKIPGRKMA